MGNIKIQLKNKIGEENYSGTEIFKGYLAV